MAKTLPTLATERLTLRELSPRDCLAFYSYASLPDFGPLAGWEPHKNITDTLTVIRYLKERCRLNISYTFAVCLKSAADKMIGTVELHSLVKGYKGELGYAINPMYQNLGYATEAARAILNYGFNTLKLQRIECFADLTNKASLRVCEKLRLRFEGMRKKGYQLYDGSVHDIAAYALTDDEFYSPAYQDFMKTVGGSK